MLNLSRLMWLELVEEVGNADESYPEFPHMVCAIHRGLWWNQSHYGTLVSPAAIFKNSLKLMK